MTVPAHPKIYHIVHVDNLGSIVADGCLWPDATMIKRQGVAVIGMGVIKQRRLTLPVACHPGLNVGDCVPFYFCSRSIMLFKIHKANDPELAYKGGQEPIVHLEADLYAVVKWMQAHRRRWAFSLSNAGAYYTEFRAQLDQLSEVGWAAMPARYWTAPDIREARQAEFLVERSFPWHLVERIGIHGAGMASRVAHAMASATHRPRTEIQPSWYY